MNVLQITDLYKIYKDGDVETVALRGVDLSVRQGEFIAITGRSGAGKSTLLSLMGALMLPSAGRILINDEDVTKMDETERANFRRASIGIVYQTDNLLPFLTAYENVMLPMQLNGQKDAGKRARDLLGEVGLSKRMNHKPAMLSGGEKQRVAIAAALANHPQLLLADELTGELDSKTADMVMSLLDHLNMVYQLSLVIVTHNKSIAARAQRQIHISDGKFYESEVSHD